MKVYLHYEDNDDNTLHKQLKITLPKSWKNGPTSKILSTFVENYNSNEILGSKNPLDENEMHLTLREGGGEDSEDEDYTQERFTTLASDAITIRVIHDRADLYVMHGKAQTLQDMQDAIQAEREKQREEAATTVQCTNFGCKNRFPRGGPYPQCRYHSAPPVFHETAKFWSCCPNKKAYDWDDFQKIPGCQTGVCSEEKQEQKQFLGGTDLREQAGEGAKLKSIDDYNKAQAAGGTDAAPILDKLRSVLGQLGVEDELYDQVVAGMKKDLAGTSEIDDSPEILDAVAAELGTKLKAAMKAIAVEQLRIK
eukprot:CAMPEP_0195293786 /NCGR_PEP_ID=MMETSP0707-20130614/13335_1 /TAXON_ID=33640 /ORGANISM="Asterionellopsis glacialis, Strain CCMP134" /LENGTH=308 /DNA_ID=CAMNT_0040354581 /DNA_START=17 /DNA_END=943 /DNA_ORIENTATION=-